MPSAHAMFRQAPANVCLGPDFGLIVRNFPSPGRNLLGSSEGNCMSSRLRMTPSSSPRIGVHLQGATLVLISQRRFLLVLKHNVVASIRQPTVVERFEGPELIAIGIGAQRLPIRCNPRVVRVRVLETDVVESKIVSAKTIQPRGGVWFGGRLPADLRRPRTRSFNLLTADGRYREGK